jgi:hypothetical protein
MYPLRNDTTRVIRTTAIILLCLFLGCSLPVTPADDTYEVLGGIVQREHPSLGRANSAFDLSKTKVTTEAIPPRAAPAVPPIFKDPQPLERLKHSPIIP